MLGPWRPGREASSDADRKDLVAIPGLLPCQMYNRGIGRTASSNLAGSDEGCLLEGWVSVFYENMKPELKPWVLCDSSQEHTFINASIKGARLSNEDAICSDGRLFGVFDGHGGKCASLLAQREIPNHFYEALDAQHTSSAPPPVAGAPIDATALVLCPSGGGLWSVTLSRDGSPSLLARVLLVVWHVHRGSPAQGLRRGTKQNAWRTPR